MMDQRTKSDRHIQHKEPRKKSVVRAVAEEIGANRPEEFWFGPAASRRALSGDSLTLRESSSCGEDVFSSLDGNDSSISTLMCLSPIVGPSVSPALSGALAPKTLAHV
jgi:hypothetical protein